MRLETLFRVQTPQSLEGVTLAQSRIRQDTGCSVVAIKSEGGFVVNPDPYIPISRNSEMILIGTYDGERQFFGPTSAYKGSSVINEQ